MTSVLTGIDAKVDSRCLTKAMDKQGCEVGSIGAPAPRRVIDMDHPDAPVERARKCDYLLLAEDANPRRLVVVPLELKSTGVNPASVQSQLQAGAQAAERIVAGIHRSGSFRSPCMAARCVETRSRICARSGFSFGQENIGSRP